MSVRAIGWVFDNFKGDEVGNRMAGQMLVMLAIADSAEDDGTLAFPGEVRLARKTRMSTRQVRRVLATLVEEGHLIRTERQHRRHNHRYDIAGMRPPDTVSGNDHRTSATDHRTSATASPDIVPLDGNTTHPKTRPIDPSYISASFDSFWSQFPRKVGKPKALTAFRQALRRASADVIVAGARRYAEDLNREDTYTAHPTTWLNRDGWEDAALPSRNGSKPVPDRAAEIATGKWRGGDHGTGAGRGPGGPATRSLPRQTSS